MEAQYSIRSLAGISGLSMHTIRAWERRYAALDPSRTGTNRRIYKEADLKRLLLLKKVVEAGNSIGHIAKLNDLALERMASHSLETLQSDAQLTYTPSGTIERCELAISKLDADSLDSVLSRHLASNGAVPTLERVVIPLLKLVEQGWAEGRLSIAQEHLVSAVLKGFLDRVRLRLNSSSASRTIVVTTPSGQIHELGALIVAAAAGDAGWNVVYLGPNLPSQEIVRAAMQCRANAVALSLVYPEGDPMVAEELLQLRATLPIGIPIMVGGRAAQSYDAALKSAGAVVAHDLLGFREALAAAS